MRGCHGGSTDSAPPRMAEGSVALTEGTLRAAGKLFVYLRSLEQRANEGLCRMLDHGFDQRGAHHPTQATCVGNIDGFAADHAGLRTVLRNITSVCSLSH